MAVQLDLLARSENVADETPLGIQERFEMFHVANPWVYDKLVTMARDLRDRGHRRIGVKLLFEVLRYQRMVATNDPTSDWRLNNVYSSRYSRLIAHNEPDLGELFETRELRAR